MTTMAFDATWTYISYMNYKRMTCLVPEQSGRSLLTSLARSFTSIVIFWTSHERQLEALHTVLLVCACVKPLWRSSATNSQYKWLKPCYFFCHCCLLTNMHMVLSYILSYGLACSTFVMRVFPRIVFNMGIYMNEPAAFYKRSKPLCVTVRHVSIENNTLRIAY